MPPPKLKQPATVLRLRCDGVHYTLDFSDISPRIERDLYVQAQITPKQALDSLQHGATFGIAAVVYLARRQAGEPVTYQTVEDGLWTAIRRAGMDDFDLAIITDDEETDAVPQP